MSTVIWTSPHGGALAFDGYGASNPFDRHITIVSKDEWGIDVLRRTVCVAAPILAAYVASLARGNVYEGFYLQSWQPSGDPLAPEFALIYKGLSSGIPDPLISNERCELMSSINATGLSVSYNGKTIVAATKEIKYVAPVTVYRYIAEGEPTGPRYGTARGEGVQVIDSRITITFSDGNSQTMAGSAPAAVATALSSNPANFVIGPSAQHIFGTPYWECTDVCRLQYPGS